MTKVLGLQEPFAVLIQKRWSSPNFYGSSIYAWTEYGDDNINAGIYRTQLCHEGKIALRERYYIPTNPRSGPQQTNRGYFANAILAWQALTNEQKEVYRERAKGKHLYGYNLFIREYMYG